MTEAELKFLRLELQVEALRVLARGLLVAVATSTPHGAASLRQRFQALRQAAAQAAPGGSNPAYSDMMAAEFQDALEDLLRYVEAGLPD